MTDRMSDLEQQQARSNKKVGNVSSNSTSCCGGGSRGCLIIYILFRPDKRPFQTKCNVSQKYLTFKKNMKLTHKKTSKPRVGQKSYINLEVFNLPFLPSSGFRRSKESHGKKGSKVKQRGFHPDPFSCDRLNSLTHAILNKPYKVSELHTSH